jgi:N-formylglutamate amidohydrolase
MIGRFCNVVRGRSPVVAAAIHDGHLVRPEVVPLLAIDDASRLREEDPYTAAFTTVSDTRVIVHRSRFEVDVNRPRELAIYASPEQAWNLRVYREQPPQGVVERSLAEYDEFYADVADLLDGVEREHGCFLLLDIHSYNHRRNGPSAPPADPATHPQVNLGTGTMPRERWAPLVDRFQRDLAAERIDGVSLDVRENVKFFGGQFPRWVNQRYPDTGCALALEFKKTFMDEWTGALDTRHAQALGRALAATLPGAIEELCKLTEAKRRRSA